MSDENNNTTERESIIQIGFDHIRTRLGYRDEELVLWSDEGKNLAYEVGIIICVGTDSSDELSQQEAMLLDRARLLIEVNRDHPDGPGP